MKINAMYLKIGGVFVLSVGCVNLGIEFFDQIWGGRTFNLLRFGLPVMLILCGIYILWFKKEKNKGNQSIDQIKADIIEKY